MRMKKFTFKMQTALCILLMFMAAMPSWAQVPSKLSDFYGKYKFTSTMELTELGKQNTDAFKQECEVIVTEDNIFDLSIQGMAGMTADLKVHTVKFSEDSWYIQNVNTAPQFGKFEMANANGDYPYYPNSYGSFNYPYDPATKTITISDFTAVLCDHPNQSAEIAAKFTDCKLTFIEGEKVEIEDISGEYRLKVMGPTITESPVPAEADLVLTTENEDFTSYSVTFTLANESGEMKFKGCVFDGSTLTIPFNKQYINDEVFLYTPYQTPEATLHGEIIFKKMKEKTSLTLDGGMYFARFPRNGEEVPEGTVKVPTSEGDALQVQYWLDGTAVKNDMTSVDFNGTYTFTASVDQLPLEEGISFDYPKTFTMTINDFGLDNYYITQFMDYDVYNLNWGSWTATAEGNTLKLSTSSPNLGIYTRSFKGDDDTPLAFDLFFSASGEKDGEPVILTMNADGTVTLGDFFISRWDFNNNTEDLVALYENITGEKANSVNKVVADKETAVYAQDGIIYVKGGTATALKVYTTDGREIFNDVATQVNGLPKGLYVVKCGESISKVLL